MADPAWSTACPDWQRRIVAGESLIPFKPLFPDSAEDALGIFRSLHVVDMGTPDNSPTMGEVSRQWVIDFVSMIFGAYNPETGRRLIRESLMLIAKKNTKSTSAAGIMLTALLLNWRQSGEMGILAPTVEVANNAFKPARDMVKADPELNDLLQVQDHIRTITHRETGATLQVVAADSETVAGKKWIFTLVDELWLFGKKPNASKMLLEATGGMASRPEGFVLYLSTQSDEPPAGVFKEKLDYARRVRDGEVIDPEFCPVLYEFPPAMLASKEYMDEANWRITNPNLDASVDASHIRRKIKEAEEGTDGSLQDVLAKHLNVEIGMNLRTDRWAGADHWQAAGITAGLSLDELLERSEVVTIGIDGGGLDDLLGIAVLGREEGADARGKWLLWSHAWAHECVFVRRKSEAPRLRGFEKDKDLTVIPDNSEEDITDVAELVAKVEASGLLDRIGVDQAGIGAIVDAIVDKKIEFERIVGIAQGWRMVSAVKTVERKLAAHGLLHGGTDLMAWCAGNAKVVPAGNAVYITKQVSGTGKIDPLMALLDAATLMSMNPKPRKKKYQLFFA